MLIYIKSFPNRAVGFDIPPRPEFHHFGGKNNNQVHPVKENDRMIRLLNDRGFSTPLIALYAPYA